MRRGRALLYEARARRVPPGLDDKIITAWNGMMISAMAEAGRVLDRPEYIEAARRSADYLLRMHSRRTIACFEPHERAARTTTPSWKTMRIWEKGWSISMKPAAKNGSSRGRVRLRCLFWSRFRIMSSEGFYHGKDHEALIVRGREGADGATPSGNAVAATFLARLSFHLDRPEFREAAVAAMRAYGKQMTRYPRGICQELVIG